MTSHDRYTGAKKQLKALGFPHSNYTHLVVAAEAIERGIDVGAAGKYMILKKGPLMRNWLDANTVLNHTLAVSSTKNKTATNAYLKGSSTLSVVGP
jgi:hypothetical protein